MISSSREKYMRDRYKSGKLSLSLAICAFAVPSGATETTTHTYDELGRLVSSSSNGGPRNGIAAETQFDPAGNRQGHAVGQPLTPAYNAAVFSISGPASLIEGETAIYTVLKTGPASGTLTVNVASNNGTAVAPNDFAAVNTTLSFLSWETVKTVPILITDDGLGDEPEQFSVLLSNPSTGASISQASAVTAISGAANQPPVPGVDMADAEVCTNADVDILANDTDPEGNYPLAVISLSAPTFGQLIWLNGTTVRFRSSVPGGGTATYVVSDSLGRTATGVIHLSATGGPCP